MNRPITSQPRGTCRYYSHPRGCFSGNTCKFLHGQSESLTPYDKSKTCVFYAKGYCRRGESCWFLHTIPDSPEQSSSGSSSGSSSEDDDPCSICLEKPVTYGLLAGCSHVFCIQCIRQWRDPAGKSGDVVLSVVTKKCPLCRSESHFITPSSHFYPHGGKKDETIRRYKESMRRVPCKYFRRNGDCPFGRDCFYQHANSDGTHHILSYGVEEGMRIHRQITENQHSTTANRMLTGNHLDDLSATIDMIRASLPTFPGGSVGSDDDENGSDDGDVSGGRDRYGQLERLAGRMLATLAAMQNMNLSDLDRGTVEDVRGEMNEMRLALERHEATQRLGEQQEEREEGTSDDLLQMEGVELSINWDGPPPLAPLSPRQEVQRPQTFVRAFDLAYEPPPSPPPSITRTELPVGELSLATSRFSTVVGNQERERMIIDLDDDEDGDKEVDELLVGIEEEEEKEEYVDSEEDVEEEYVSASEGDDEQLPMETALEHVNTRSEDLPTEPTSRMDSDSEPPFVTDGRGRVVWSSARSGRSVQNGGGGRSRAWNSKTTATTAFAVVRKAGSTDGIADLSESEAEGRDI